MTVVRLPKLRAVEDNGWRAAELRQLQTIYAAYACQGAASEWAVGTTESGAPQFYLLGPGPDHDCVLCVSRVVRTYVLEDGRGALLAEESSLASVVSTAARVAPQGSATLLLASVVLGWQALRRFVEEKVEPLLAEPVELITHISPQLAALA
jgi:hypothetical protein